MQDAGLTIRVDAIGNTFGLWEGSRPSEGKTFGHFIGEVTKQRSSDMQDGLSADSSSSSNRNCIVASTGMLHRAGLQDNNHEISECSQDNDWVTR